MIQDIRNGPPDERLTDASSSRKRTIPASARAAGERAKRVRVSRACDQCRAGREKCDGGQPICQTCSIQERSCSYNEPPKKRGIQPNYIRTLELTLAWIFQTFPNTENTLSHLLPDSEGTVHQQIAFKDANAAETLHASWRNSIICRQIDQLLSGSAIDVPANGAVDLPYNSPPQSAHPEGSLSSFDLRHVPALTSTTAATQGTQSDLPFKLPEKAWSMLEDYFAFTQTWLPITEKHDVLRLMYTYPDAGLPRAEAVDPRHAELWSIMAWSAMRMEGEGGLETARCRDIATSLIPSDAKLELSHANAMLILSLVDLSRGALMPAWLMIGSAIRVLVHQIALENKDLTLFGDRLRITYLAAFMLESTVATLTGALPHLKPDHIASLGFLVEDGLDEWSPWQDPGASSIAEKSPARSISTFNELVRMALRRSEALVTSPQTPRTHQDRDVVFDLLKNGTPNQTRLHPTKVLERHNSTVNVVERDHGGLAGSAQRFHARTGSAAAEIWSTQQMDPQQMSLNQDYPFMTIPNETTDSQAGSTPARMTVSTATPSFWPGEGPQTGPSSGVGNTSGGDIFEELAMLDRSDSSQKPNFMENLGFGPDLDLAEFFGPDYQPSDPLLAYLQPQDFGTFSQSFETGLKDTG